MNRKVLVFAAALFAVVVSASSIAPAFAITWTEHATVTGSTVFDVPGEAFKVQITFAHFDWGEHGARDHIAVHIETPPDAPIRWLMLGWFSDTEQGVDYMEGVLAALGPTPVVVGQLGRWQLQICKIGKTAMVVWKVPLEIPVLQWGPEIYTPAVTIPPGCLVLNGYGCPESGSSSDPWGVLSSTYTKGYDACGFLVCPRWRYWGRVGGYTAGDTMVFMDRTFTVTLPD